MALTKDQLKAENQSSFPDNTDGLITPQITRDYNDDVIDSLVVSSDTGSFITETTQLNEFTESADIRLNNIETTTASLDISVTNLNSYTSSADGRLNNIETTTASLQTQIDNINTGSLLETASVNLNTITFTKADTTTFDITVDTGSAGGATDITPLNQFTQSADLRLSSLEAETASLQSQIDTKLDSSSFNSYTQSTDLRLDSLETFTGSLNGTQVSFDSSSTSLTSSNVQDAITELDTTKAPISALSSNLIVYPTNAASSIAGYSILVTSPDEVGYNTTAVDVPTGTISGSNQFIAALATTGSLFTGNPGVINITTLGNVRRTGGGPNSSADFYFEVYKRSGSVETLIATSNNTTEVNADTYEQFFATALLTDGTFTEDDVIVTKYYGSLINPAGADPSFDFQFGGEEPIRTLIPVPASVITDPTLTLRVDNLEQFTASQETINGGYNQFTSSADGRLNNIETFTSSVDISLTNINSYTASTDGRLDNIEAATGSYAITGSNTFTANQIISGTLDIEQTFTASLGEGLVYVGDANGRTVTAETSSFGGGGATMGVFTVGLLDDSVINPATRTTASLFSDSSSVENNPDTWTFTADTITIPTTGYYNVQFQGSTFYDSGDARQYPVINFMINGVLHPVQTSTYMREDDVRYPLILNSVLNLTQNDKFQISKFYQISDSGNARFDVKLAGSLSMISLHQIR